MPAALVRVTIYLSQEKIFASAALHHGPAS